MKKYSLIIIVVLILAGIYFTAIHSAQKTVTIQSSVTDPSLSPYLHSTFCLPEYVNMATSSGSAYINTSLKFSISVPLGWNIPPVDDADPHFGNCENRDGFEIASGQNPSSLYSAEYKEYLHPTYSKTIHGYTDLVPGAIVREFQIIDPEGEGWPHWVLILFTKEKVAYYFASEHPIIEYPFVSTFRLVK